MQNPNFSGKFPKSSCPQLFIYLLCILSCIFRILLFSQLFFIIIILLLRSGITNTEIQTCASIQMVSASRSGYLNKNCLRKQYHYKSGYDENT